MSGRKFGHGCAGWTLVELVAVVAVIIVVSAIALPMAPNIVKAFHLTSATSSVAGVIQSTRYQAIMSGCPYQIAFNQNTTTYQITTQQVSGSPPTCAATYTNSGGPVNWSTSTDVSLNASTTLQFNPNGIVTVPAGSRSLVFSNGVTTRTVFVSGVGNVKVTSP